MRKIFGIFCLSLSLFLFSLPFLSSCSQHVSAESITTTIPRVPEGGGPYDVVLLDPDIIPFTSFKDNQRSAASLFSVVEFGYPLFDNVDSSFVVPLNISYMTFLMDGNNISFDNSSIISSHQLSLSVPFGGSPYSTWSNSQSFYPYFVSGSNTPQENENGRLYYGCSSSFVSGHSYSFYYDFGIKFTGYYHIEDFYDEFGISDGVYPDVSIYSSQFDEDTAIGYYVLGYVIPCRDLSITYSSFYPDIDDVMPANYFTLWVASPCLIDFSELYNRGYSSIPSQLADRFKSFYGGYGYPYASIDTELTLTVNEYYYYDILDHWYNTRYDEGYNAGYNIGLNTSLGDVTPFDTIVYGVNSFLNLELFPSVKIGWILSFGFGLILLGLAISLFKHG